MKNTNTLLIKNMVCERCKEAVRHLLVKEGYNIESIELGKVVVEEEASTNYDGLEKQLRVLGFELIKESNMALVEKIKLFLIQKLEKSDTNDISEKLERELGKSYSILSKTFSKSEGITIEKFFINLKVEKVKEYIQLQQMNFSDISYTLNYKNSSHLAKQFKKVTGMSMTDYKKMQDWGRKPLDQIV